MTMTIPLYLLFFLSIPSLISALTTPAKRSTPLGYYDPYNSGGSLVTYIPGPYTINVGEPANAILSGNSDPAILVDQQTNGGLRNYFVSFGYATECLGQHSGTPQALNLGDGLGLVNQTAEIRWDYGNPELGTCTETIEGGSHFRYWPQNGPNANSGAIFMAFSYEMPLIFQHNIVVNGYNLGRDWAIGNITNQSTIINTATVSNGSTFSGRTSYGGYVYQTTVTYVSGMLSNTSNGINHAGTVGVNGVNAIDGLVAVMEATIVQQPQASTASDASPLRLSWTPLLTALVACAAYILS